MIIEPKAFVDERGYFMETFKESDFAKAGINGPFVQDNHSRSGKGVLRGLHYQLNPLAQAKVVYVTRGKILDVAVDIRRGSPSYAKWIGEVLSDENHRALFIPEGFAHGYYVLSDIADVYYKANREYSANHERGIAWNDATVGINWPSKNPILSKKDAALPPLANAENNFEFRRDA
jgi:dTDP-4-dehydrorhamnose 3,5-epimerase